MVTTFAYSMLAERKILGWMQLRPGPNRVGPWGMMQPAADAAKMMFKEDLTPKTADPLIYRLAPFISLLTAMGALRDHSVRLVGESGTWAIGNVNAGILFIFAHDVDRRVRHLARRLGVGLEVSAAGQRALDRADDLLRAVDVDVGRRRADPRRHDVARRDRRTRRRAGGSSSRRSSGFVIYIITAVAETNRAPFDLVEAETELVGGFHTEYSGLRFGLFFIAEYLNMITVSCIATLLFFGGWNAPFGLTVVPGHRLVRRSRSALFMFFYIWLRATLPRLRYDRLMAFGWKVLLPVATLNLIVTAVVVAVRGISWIAQEPLQRRRDLRRASRRPSSSCS